MITPELYKLNKDCIKTFSEIKIQYLTHNKKLSNKTHEIIKILEAENKEFENGVRNSRENNTDRGIIKWHGKGNSK